MNTRCVKGIRTNKDGSEICRTVAAWFKRRMECCERANEACEVCGTYCPQYAGQAHHKNGTRGLGGGKRDDRLSNLLWICFICHQKVHQVISRGIQ